MNNECMYIMPLVRLLSEATEKKANERLLKYNITATQVRLLSEIYNMDNKECTLKELESKFSYSSTAIAGGVSRLEAKGYLDGFVSNTDKRIKCVRLLPAGEAVIKQAIEEIKCLENDLLINMSEEEKRTLWQLLKRTYSEMC